MIKTVIKTVIATTVVLTFVLSVSLKSILGVFGFAIESLDTLNQMRTSQKIVQEMKERNKDKRNNVKKKFATKAGTRVASSAAAAVTIGTAAVAITVFVLEAHDYCEEKEELQKEEDLLFNKQGNTDFDIKDCVSEAKNDSKEILASAKDSVSETVHDSWEKTRNFSDKQWDDFLRSTDIALSELGEVFGGWLESGKTWFDWW